jgi:dihydrofolate reductase
MPLSIIYARSKNHCIGRAGKVPWDLPDEYAAFDKTTCGKAIIMGRRTFEDHCCALPHRLNIVLSARPLVSNDLSKTDTLLRCSNLDDALAAAQDYSKEYFVIGGAELIMDVLPRASTVYETIVYSRIVGDTYIPEIDYAGWSSQLISRHPVDDRHEFAFSIYQHDRAGKSCAL